MLVWKLQAWHQNTHRTRHNQREQKRGKKTKLETSQVSTMDQRPEIWYIISLKVACFLAHFHQSLHSQVLPISNNLYKASIAYPVTISAPEHPSSASNSWGGCRWRRCCCCCRGSRRRRARRSPADGGGGSWPWAAGCCRRPRAAAAGGAAPAPWRATPRRAGAPSSSAASASPPGSTASSESSPDEHDEGSQAHCKNVRIWSDPNLITSWSCSMSCIAVLVLPWAVQHGGKNFKLWTPCLY